MFGFAASSEGTLYSAGFYRTSCALNAFCMACGGVLLPFPGAQLCAPWALVHLGFLVEQLVRGPALGREAMRRRYIVKILSGMGAIALSMALVARDYVIYLPIVMGLMYLNANTLIRSSAIQGAVFGLMPLSVVKAVAMHHSNPVEAGEYAATSALLVASGLLTYKLFSTNKSVFERNERMAATLPAVGRMQDELSAHDVNNSLASLYILSNERYRADKGMFLEELDRRVEQVKELVDARRMDRRDRVDVGKLLDRMPGAAGDCALVREFADDVPVTANRNMLFSMLRNFLENSSQAAERSGRACTVRVRKRGDLLELEDDAGGFDVERIGSGESAKSGGGHGVFLRTVADPAVQAGFGYRLRISRTGRGTLVSIAFADVGDGSGKAAAE